MNNGCKKKTRILFLCTGNSCRSQMAEGWARELKKDVIEPYSAGLEKHGLNPYAIKAMQEIARKQWQMRARRTGLITVEESSTNQIPPSPQQDTEQSSSDG